MWKLNFFVCLFDKWTFRTIDSDFSFLLNTPIVSGLLSQFSVFLNEVHHLVYLERPELKL